jgi:hypothetical protein
MMISPDAKWLDCQSDKDGSAPALHRALTSGAIVLFGTFQDGLTHDPRNNCPDERLGTEK